MINIILIGFDKIILHNLCPSLVHLMNKFGYDGDDFTLAIIEAKTIRNYSNSRTNRIKAAPYIIIQSTDEEGTVSICEIMSRMFRVNVIHQRGIDFFPGNITPIKKRKRF